MAATAAATASSSFSTAKHALRNLLTTHIATEPLVKLGHRKALCSPLASQQLCYGIEPIPISSHKCRVFKASAMAATAEAGPGKAEVVAAAACEEKGEDEVNTKLYFGNLPYHCDSAQLAGIVQQYGTPELVEVLYNRETGKSRGFAFVTMSNVEDCNAVIENLDEREYGGRCLRVNFADRPRKREQLYPETEHKLFVGNLSWSVTSESLYQAFQEYGEVVGARVLYDGDTSKSRGYGFVSYSTRSDMEKALAALNGVELEGRAMRVSLAEGKKS